MAAACTLPGKTQQGTQWRCQWVWPGEPPAPQRWPAQEGRRDPPGRVTTVTPGGQRPPITERPGVGERKGGRVTSKLKVTPFGDEGMLSRGLLPLFVASISVFQFAMPQALGCFASLISHHRPLSVIKDRAFFFTSHRIFKPLKKCVSWNSFCRVGPASCWGELSFHPPPPGREKRERTAAESGGG